MEKGQGKRADTLQTDKVFTRKEYIEREAALAAIMEKQNEYVDKAWKPVVGGMWQQDELFTNAALGCRAACEQVKAIPAADVVPVVRCGECKYWKRIRNDCILASCELYALVRSEDFFCADGVRKDGDGE